MLFRSKNSLLWKDKGSRNQMVCLQLKGRVQLKCDGNKSSQPFRSQVLGVKVQRKSPMKYRGINNTQQDHQLDTHWRGKKEFKAQRVQSPICPTDGGGVGGNVHAGGPVTTFSARKGLRPVFVGLMHYILIKRIPGVENSCSRCSTCLCLFPKKKKQVLFCFVFSLYGLFQVAAKPGKKCRTNIYSQALSDPTPSAV